MKHYWIDILLILLIALIWGAYFSVPVQTLQIIACDVGQGDSILIQYGDFQTLIDGGPDASVLDCLGRYMPYWDHTIDLAVLTHPESDHYSGFVHVFERYFVKQLIANSVDNDTEGYGVLKKLVGSKGIPVFIPHAGERLIAGPLIFDIYNPLPQMVTKDGDKLGMFESKQNLNDYSITLLLTFNQFKALFTGDLSPDQTKLMLGYYNIGDTNYLKVPHHGSTNGLIEDLLLNTTPEIAVISVGEKNRYGHPHKAILDMLSHQNINLLRTDEMGSIEVDSDGSTYRVK